MYNGYCYCPTATNILFFEYTNDLSYILKLFNLTRIYLATGMEINFFFRFAHCQKTLGFDFWFQKTLQINCFWFFVFKTGLKQP